MGKKTHGAQLLIAIEANDHKKVHDILASQIRNKTKIQEILTADIRRIPANFTECPLLLAARIPDASILKYFITTHGTNINFQHKEGESRKLKITTPLIVAVKKCNYDTVETLLTHNVDTSVQDHKGKTALHHAVQKAEYRMAKMILIRGAKCNIADKSNNTPLHIATKYGHLELVKLLIKYGADVYKRGAHGAIPIHIAAREGHIPMMQLLVNNDVDVDTKVPCYEDDKERAPIHVAAEEGQAEAVLALLDRFGANPNVRDSEGETPIHCTVISEWDPHGMRGKDDYTETVKVLVQCGAEVNLRNGRGETALHLAARNEFQKIVDLLVLAGADPAIEDNDNNKPIDLVSEEDPVSKQALRRAMDNRELIMSNAMEQRARGFSTDMRSQSVMSMTRAGFGSPMSRAGSVAGSVAGSPLPLGRSGSLPGLFHQTSLYEDAYRRPMYGSNPRINLMDRFGGMPGPRLVRQGSSSSFHTVTGLPDNTYPIYAHIDDAGSIVSESAALHKSARRKRAAEIHRNRMMYMDPGSDSSQNDEHIPHMRARAMSADILQHHQMSPLAQSNPNPEFQRQNSGRGSIHSAHSAKRSSTSSTVSGNSNPGPGIAASLAKAVNERAIQQQASHQNESHGNRQRKEQARSDTERESESSTFRDVASMSSASTLRAEERGPGSPHGSMPHSSHSSPAHHSHQSSQSPTESEAIYGNISITSQSPIPQRHEGNIQKDHRMYGNSSPLRQNHQEVIVNTVTQSEPRPVINHAVKPIHHKLITQLQKKHQQQNHLHIPNGTSGGMSDSDDTFFDDESFDTLSEYTEDTNRMYGNISNSRPPKALPAPPPAPKPQLHVPKQNKVEVVTVPQDPVPTPNSAPTKVQQIVSTPPKTKDKPPASGGMTPQQVRRAQDPKLQNWLAEQNALLQGIEQTDTTSVQNPGNSVSGKEPNTNHKESNVTDKIVETRQAALATEEDIDSYDDDSTFDTIPESELDDIVLQQQKRQEITAKINLANSELNDLNAPGKTIHKPVPAPRNSPMTVRNNQEELPQQSSVPAVRVTNADNASNQKQANWEKVAMDTSAGSMYWETTDTEVIYDAVEGGKPKPPKKPNFIPEADYVDMRKNSQQSLVAQQSSPQSPKSQSPGSQHSPGNASMLSQHTAKNQNAIVSAPVPGHSPSSIDPYSQVERALEPSKNIQDEYKFYKQMGQLSYVSPGTIEQTVESKYQQDEVFQNTENLQQSPQHMAQYAAVMNKPGRTLSNRSTSSVSSSNSQSRAIPVSVPQPNQRHFSGDSHEDVYEVIPQKHGRKVTIGREMIIPEKKTPKDHDHRTLTFNTGGKSTFAVVGGNADGIFVHRIDPGCDAEIKGLMEGDQIVKINGESVKGRTKEEVGLQLMGKQPKMNVTVRYKKDRYDRIMQCGGMGDSFFVKAYFNYTPAQKGEIPILKGDVFSVRDTLPEGQMGSWRALKVNAKPSENQHGLIPNEARAEQVALSQQRATQRGLEKENKGSFLRRSLRRAKSSERVNKEKGSMGRSHSADRLGNDCDNNVPKMEDGKTYERVEQRQPGFVRPVVLLGLFCDTVREKLCSDSPGRFELSPPELENLNPGPGENPVELNKIKPIIDKKLHCIMIVSPKAIEYLHKTALYPMVIYLKPENKATIKQLRAKMAPKFERRSSYMYEEALTFEKTYSHLFTATVTYTLNETWFTLLKDTIGRFQNQPLWYPAPPRVEDDAPSDFSQSPETSPIPASVSQPPRLRPVNRPPVPPSGNVPNPIQNIIQRHAMQVPDVAQSDSELLDYRDGPDEEFAPKHPMTLTYDGYFLSDPSKSPARGNMHMSSQSVNDPYHVQMNNGRVQHVDQSPRSLQDLHGVMAQTDQGTGPRSILKNRSPSMSSQSSQFSNFNGTHESLPVHGELVQQQQPRYHPNQVSQQARPQRRYQREPMVVQPSNRPPTSPRAMVNTQSKETNL